MTAYVQYDSETCKSVCFKSICFLRRTFEHYKNTYACWLRFYACENYLCNEWEDKKYEKSSIVKWTLEKTKRGNQQWTIHGHWQHWTQEKDEQYTRTQNKKNKLKNIKKNTEKAKQHGPHK